MTARIEALFLYPRTRAEAVPVAEAVALKGTGLDGDHDRHPSRQLTVISSEAWKVANAELGTDLPPQTRRANVVVSGVSLAETRGRRLRLGPVLLEINGETDPCQRMEEAYAGLRAALTPEWRGGVFGHIVEDGPLRVGDDVAFE